MKNAEQEKKNEPRHDYDGTLKSFIDHYTDKEIIDFIRGAFGEEFPADSVVARLNVESHVSTDNKENDKKMLDYLISINGRMFHFEFENGKNNEVMSFRVFEYGFRAAIMHGREDKENSVLMTLPKSKVFYLEDSEETPTELTIGLKLPYQYRLDDENHILYYSVPTIRERDYTAQQMREQSLGIMLPFYTLNRKNKASDKTLGEFLEYHREAYATTLQMYEDKELSLQVAYGMIENLRSSTHELICKSNIADKEGAVKRMQAIEQGVKEQIGIRMFTDYFADMDGLKAKLQQERQRAEQAYQREEQERQQRLKPIAKAIAKGRSAEDIYDIFDMSEKELKAFRKQNKSLIEEMKAELLSGK
ncbi:hypothetical protein AGMMS49975_20140 [Clostridia bacterium]|nr:hypothetical protein AGMMS49975_20140 [Clostridia bacterium]